MRGRRRDDSFRDFLITTFVSSICGHVRRHRRRRRRRRRTRGHIGRAHAAGHDLKPRASASSRQFRRPRARVRLDRDGFVPRRDARDDAFVSVPRALRARFRAPSQRAPPPRGRFRFPRRRRRAPRVRALSARVRGAAPGGLASRGRGGRGGARPAHRGHLRAVGAERDQMQAARDEDVAQIARGSSTSRTSSSRPPARAPRTRSSAPRAPSPRASPRRSAWRWRSARRGAWRRPRPPPAAAAADFPRSKIETAATRRRDPPRRRGGGASAPRRVGAPREGARVGRRALQGEGGDGARHRRRGEVRPRRGAAQTSARRPPGGGCRGDERRRGRHPAHPAAKVDGQGA